MHLHSNFSVDADDSIESMCKKAISRGLHSICLTEHIDLNPNDEGCGFYDQDGYFKAINRAKKKYDDKLLILTGIEFSEPHIYPDHLKCFYSRQFDAVLGSVHWLDDLFVGDEKILEKYDRSQLADLYYKHVYETVKNGGFDILAHLDFPKRYVDSFGEPRLIDDILKEVIRKDIALEINTSSLRKGFEEAMPGERILRKYSEMGGRKVTVGSDAHRVNEIASNFDYAVRLIKMLNLIPGYFRQKEFIPLKW